MSSGGRRVSTTKRRAVVKVRTRPHTPPMPGGHAGAVLGPSRHEPGRARRILCIPSSVRSHGLCRRAIVLTRVCVRWQAVDDMHDASYVPPMVPKSEDAKQRICAGIAKNELLAQCAARPPRAIGVALGCTREAARSPAREITRTSWERALLHRLCLVRALRAQPLRRSEGGHRQRRDRGADQGRRRRHQPGGPCPALTALRACPTRRRRFSLARLLGCLFPG